MLNFFLSSISSKNIKNGKNKKECYVIVLSRFNAAFLLIFQMLFTNLPIIIIVLTLISITSIFTFNLICYQRIKKRKFRIDIQQHHPFLTYETFIYLLILRVAVATKYFLTKLKAKRVKHQRKKNHKITRNFKRMKNFLPNT